MHIKPCFLAPSLYFATLCLVIFGAPLQLSIPWNRSIAIGDYAIRWPGRCIDSQKHSGAVALQSSPGYKDEINR